MNKQTPYAALSRTTCKTKATDYYIRFPSCCAKLFDGAKRCYVLKTDGNSYIVIQPIWKHENNEKPWTHALFQEKKGHCTRISVTGKVRNGYLPVRFFDGSHYKIKRRSSNGSVYICLDEPIKEDEA